MNVCVLASGRCERMPNKHCLAIRSGTSVLENSIHAAQLQAASLGCRVLVTVPSLNGPEAGIARNCSDDIQILERDPVGLVKTVVDIACELGATLFLFGDNLYPQCVDLHVPHVVSFAAAGVGSVRRGFDEMPPESIAQLDGWNTNGVWSRRGLDHAFKFVGWLYLPGPLGFSAASMPCSTPQLLNRTRAHPVIWDAWEWADLGTPEAYAYHWRLR